MLWLWATVWTPLSYTLSFPGRDHFVQIISFPSTEGFSATLVGASEIHTGQYGEELAGLRPSTYTPIISCVMYKKMEPVVNQCIGTLATKHNSLAPLVLLHEPILSSYYV